MMFMDAGIQMDTVFGDASANQGGLFGKLLGAGKRLVTGESLFTTVYTNGGSGKRRVAFAAPYPGKILPMDLKQLGGTLICQKDAFLCAARGVALGIDFQQRLSVGFFGGEGFIMQRLDGDGLAFVHAGGTVIRARTAAGQTLLVDTGCLVALTPSVSFDVQYVGKIKTALFGGEGLFFAKLTGPGTVWLQSLPFSRLAVPRVRGGAAARRLARRRVRARRRGDRRRAGRHLRRRRRIARKQSRGDGLSSVSTSPLQPRRPTGPSMFRRPPFATAAAALALLLSALLAGPASPRSGRSPARRSSSSSPRPAAAAPATRSRACSPRRCSRA